MNSLGIDGNSYIQAGYEDMNSALGKRNNCFEKEKSKKKAICYLVFSLLNFVKMKRPS
jgi:hypothetical protein